MVQDHASSVGKYCSELSGFLELYSASFLMNVGHVLLQLAWSLVLQDMHALSVARQLLVLWGPAQLPHISLSLMQSLAKWFQTWNLRHLVGSLQDLSTWHFLLQINRPFVMALLAALTLQKVSSRCTVLWLGALLSTALAHLADIMVFGSRLLVSQISRQWLSCSGLMARGTLKVIIL